MNFGYTAPDGWEMRQLRDLSISDRFRWTQGYDWYHPTDFFLQVTGPPTDAGVIPWDEEGKSSVLVCANPGTFVVVQVASPPESAKQIKFEDSRIRG